jgi:hypothetical protein
MSTVIAVTAATVAQFVVGAVWYSLLFGKLWGRIHGFDKLPKAKQDALVKEIGPYYGLQLLVTILAAAALARLIQLLPNYSAYTLSLILWIGFIVPTQASSIIFGNDEKKVLPLKLAVVASGSLACTLVGAAVIKAII